MLLGKMSCINVLKLFNAWAVNGPEYFPDLHETAQYDLLPESNGTKGKFSESIDCSGIK